MKIQISLQWLLAASVYASQARRPVRLARAPVLKFTNTSIQSTTSTFSSPSISTADFTSSDDPDYQIFTLPPAISTKQGDCIANSTITYFSSVYPTVYVTVESSYEVTVTASNVSVTDAPTIYETPATACVTTVLIPEVSGELVTGSPESDSPLPITFASTESSENKGSRTGSFPVLTVAPPKLSAETVVTTYSIPSEGLRLTSTVTVTKKTPVPVVQVPQDTNPPVTFKQVPTTQSPQTTDESPGRPPVSTPSPNDNNNNDNNNGKPGADNNNNNNNNDHGGGGNNVNTGDGSGVNSLPATNNNSPSPTPPPLAGAQAGASKLGEIIASIINSPFVAPVPVPGPATITSPPAAAPTIVPTVATIGGIAVTVNAPNVIIGGSVVTIPTDAQSRATVNVNGQTFTVLSDQIIAPGTTYDLIPTSAHNFAAMTTPTLSTQSASIVTANGIILTIGPTQAIISGTTYQIGANAPNTQINLNGQTISIGNNGVIFPSSTTFAPAITIAENKYKLVTAEGLTFSIGASEAVISGTTYTIGPSAKQSTTIAIGTKTLTIGPNGLVLASTTINPTSVPTVSVATTSGSKTSTGSKASAPSTSLPSSVSSSSSSSSSGSAALRSSASSLTSIFPSSLFANIYMLAMAVGFGFLPVFISLLCS